MLVGGPHTEEFSPVLYVLAGGAASAVEAFAVFHAERNDACFVGIAAFGLVAFGEAAIVVAYDSAVAYDVHIGELIVDDFGK